MAFSFAVKRRKFIPMKRVFNLVACLALIAMLVGSWGCIPRKRHSSGPESMEMKPYQEPSYGLSLPITPNKALLKALDKAGRENRIVKIPVVVRLEAGGIRAWEEAFLGGDENLADEDKIRIRLNDSHLGLSFADRLHQYCPQGEWCKLWLTGYWAQDLTAINGDPEPSTFPFSIRAVLGPQKEGELLVVYFAVQ